MDLARYRKGIIAILAAAVTLGQTFGAPVTEELSDSALAVFDSIAALLVILVPND